MYRQADKPRILKKLTELHIKHFLSNGLWEETASHETLCVVFIFWPHLFAGTYNLVVELSPPMSKSNICPCLFVCTY